MLELRLAAQTRLKAGLACLGCSFAMPNKFPYNSPYTTIEKLITETDNIHI